LCCFFHELSSFIEYSTALILSFSGRGHRGRRRRSG
jgi:hypothetical protein